ncbi:ubiquitin-like protein 3 [Cherax quadricarinatus]
MDKVDYSGKMNMLLEDGGTYVPLKHLHAPYASATSHFVESHRLFIVDLKQLILKTFVFQINLRLILVSGKTKEFLFSPSESAGDIAQFVFDNWPEEWVDESVSKAEILRLIYQGRFLHGNVTLGALGLPAGKTCVMHLVPRENLPEPNSQDQRQKSKGGSSSCCSASCAIL